jgi:hypothetical protein
LNEREKTSSWIEIFFDIVRAAYLGQEYRLDSTTFKLSPRIARPYDFSRRTIKSGNEYDRLMSSLDSRFKDAAGSDLYRRGTGWLDRGTRDGKIRIIEINKEPHIIPVLTATRIVAIDTSTIEGHAVVLGFLSLPDFQSAYTYLERHLELPKTHNHEELHWSKLNQECRRKVLDNFPVLLQISCDALLVIKTDALISPKGKHESVLTNLIDGCFSGYESTEGKFRQSLREHFYAKTNNTPIHCDADFSPLAPLKVATTYVKRLGDGLRPAPTPTFVDLRSHESKPIQVADMLIGAMRNRLQENNTPQLLTTLKFDKRKIKSQKGKTVSAWFWTKEGIGVGKSSNADAASSGGHATC